MAQKGAHVFIECILNQPKRTDGQTDRQIKLPLNKYMWGSFTLAPNSKNNIIIITDVCKSYVHAFSLIQEVKDASTLHAVVVESDPAVQISTASADVINDNSQGKPLNLTF